MDELIGQKIHITGIVQGVGFRPFIFNLAERLKLNGWVRNTSSGVDIELDGTQQQLHDFVRAVRSELPPLARIDSLSVQQIQPNGYTTFEIIFSQPEEGKYIPISPDVSICPDCLAELFNPSNRRYRYPFINCTNCGPRFSIIKDIPYDRPKTTMAGFKLCPDCAREYQDPHDRRFHAQPTACPECGPHLELVVNGQATAIGDQAVLKARQMLQHGKILAAKGLGGFHLVCDACDERTVEALRQRKKRSDKPFALMAFDMETVRRHARVTDAEHALLVSRQRPIVLLDRLPASSIAANTAPYQRTLGMMLPYTPLHYLLLEPQAGYPEVLVMTSGNLSDEPIAYTNTDAFARLGAIADAFLVHNRDIHMRVDDSVLRVVDAQPYVLRRSRGYVPDTISLHRAVPPILAAGAELKNTFCLTRDYYAFISHHIGDLENLETLQSLEEGIPHFERLFRVNPQTLACDLHPDYLSTRYAQHRSQTENLPLVQIQHHHAHLASCLAENGWNSDAPVIGLIYDGTGFGSDGAIWGGEVLVGGYPSFSRRYHLAYTPLPGGDASARKVSRMALAHLRQAGIPWHEDLAPCKALSEEELVLLRFLLEKRINSPLTSSMGRLFDAAASLVGVRQQATYEGQAAIDFEALADPDESGFYPFDIQADLISPQPLWQCMLEDLQANTPPPVISARFHNSVSLLNLNICMRIRSELGLNDVALSGGVWQNRVLLQNTRRLLADEGFHILHHHLVPTNDGGIALGQALIAASTLQ